MTSSKVSVLIAGAGPTGLVLALWLKNKGVSFRIIDKNPKPGLTSRALAVQARTLEFYQQLGIVDRILAEGLQVPKFTFLRQGKPIAEAPLGAVGQGMTPFPYLHFLSQDIHEGILCDELKKRGVEIERETDLLKFTETENGITAKVKAPQGEEEIWAEYLCGCDGAHSIVRHGANIPFTGGTYQQVFYVADVIPKTKVPADKLQISVSPASFCIVMPIKQKNSTRLTGLVPPEKETNEVVTFEDVRDSVKRDSGIEVDSVNWFSSYKVHHRVAEKFMTRRIFLAGDAGHIHSPAGGQGMNTGIGDAVNLAWKLTEVIQGRAPQNILNTYETERIAFAKVLVKTTDFAFRFIASRTAFGSFWRAYLLPALFTRLSKRKWFLRFVFRTLSQVRIRYRQSALSEGVTGGDRLPWRGENFTSLKSMAWQIHVYGKLDPTFAQEAKALGLTTTEFAGNENGFYLIRPDGYIALDSSTQSSTVLRSYIEKNKLKLA